MADRGGPQVWSASSAEIVSHQHAQLRELRLFLANRTISYLQGGTMAAKVEPLPLGTDGRHVFPVLA